MRKRDNIKIFLSIAAFVLIVGGSVTLALLLSNKPIVNTENDLTSQNAIDTYHLYILISLVSIFLGLVCAWYAYFRKVDKCTSEYFTYDAQCDDLDDLRNECDKHIDTDKDLGLSWKSKRDACTLTALSDEDVDIIGLRDKKSCIETEAHIRQFGTPQKVSELMKKLNVKTIDELKSRFRAAIQEKCGAEEFGMIKQSVEDTMNLYFVSSQRRIR